MTKKEAIELTNSRYRLGYHVSAPSGWINDPNGFCYFDGYYHVFFQHHPHSAEWGPMHWGHARSKDLVHWESLPIALTPGDKEDEDGCFSGSAIEKDGVLYLFYTGHHYYGDGDKDHFWQNQNMAYSTDGIHFTKYEKNPIIAKEPGDNTHHFRDPKVWEHEGTYYMILGSQEEDGLGRAIVYSSKDLLDWEYEGAISKANGLKTEGFMWECPDFFNLDGKDILLLSPQGIDAQGKDYLNLFQTGYFVGDYDYDNVKFTHGAFKELDKGHDFYATQTTEAPDGRRIVIAWMDMWESPLPEQEDGWAGALTIPRELRLKNNHLYMTPVKELEKLRVKEISSDSVEVAHNLLVASDASSSEILVDIPLSGSDKEEVTFALKTIDEELVSLSYSKETNEFILKRSDKDDLRYGTIQPCDKLSLRAFVDTSSIEIFINNGELVFTERFYTEEKTSVAVTVSEKETISYTVYQLENDAVSYN
ncbi:glycoside hydrolase family 32 protein [Vagococcus sp. JNUCC 83]